MHSNNNVVKYDIQILSIIGGMEVVMYELPICLLVAKSEIEIYFRNTLKMETEKL